MFEVGDFVVNSTNGICKISDLVDLDMSGSIKQYYLLVPVYEETAKVYIPVDSAAKRIRRVLDENEANSVIESISSVDETIIDNEKEREMRYKEAIKSCDPRQLIAILKCLYSRKKARLEMGKKSTAVDDRYSKLAENLFYSELVFVTGRTKEEIEGTVADKLGAIIM